MQEWSRTPESGFGVDVAEVDTAAVVTAHGDIDLYTAPAFRSALERALATGAGTVVVDLADVGFMDSTGFGQLAWLVGRGPRVVAANCRPIVRNALRLMGMDRLMDVHPYGEPHDWPGAVVTAP